MARLNKEQILTADDLRTEVVDVPLWGGSVSVKMLTGIERDAFEASVVVGIGANQKTNLRNIRARLCAITMVDDEGNRLFSDADVVSLGRKSSAALDLVFSVAQKLNGLTDADVKDLEKNSEGDQNDSSISN